jgi:putative redox protein
MIAMKAHSEWKHDDIYEGFSDEGNTIVFDTSATHTHGPSPVQAVLMALCACTSVDVVSILQKKRQEITALRVSAEAERAEHPPQVFTKIRLTYTIRGKVDRKAAEDAVSLSKNKYCSVSQMLDCKAEIGYEIVLPDADPAGEPTA